MFKKEVIILVIVLLSTLAYGIPSEGCINTLTADNAWSRFKFNDADDVGVFGPEFLSYIDARCDTSSLEAYTSCLGYGGKLGEGPTTFLDTELRKIGRILTEGEPSYNNF